MVTIEPSELFPHVEHPQQLLAFVTGGRPLLRSENRFKVALILSEVGLPRVGLDGETYQAIETVIPSSGVSCRSRRRQFIH